MSTRENIFVFVVCGSREHIDTLHFSLDALKRFSKNKIIVLTDTLRNEIPVEHGDVIDIRTPERLDHHQASIYLKTGIHHFLPGGSLYCYLDTDVVALDAEADTIFSRYVSPITFAKDHCGIDTFSPAAIRCGCQEKFDRNNEKLTKYIAEYKTSYAPRIDYINTCFDEIHVLEKKLKESKNRYRWHKLKYKMPGRYYALTEDYKMDKQTGYWYDRHGFWLIRDLLHFVFDRTGFRWVDDKEEWQDESGVSFSNPTCTHLVGEIKNRYGVMITPPDWNHWNGGVFLFDDSSHIFLEEWHRATMSIFDDVRWKTRDQGTLAMTVWKLGLQNHPTLAPGFNFIADYNSNKYVHHGDLSFTARDYGETLKPVFIHLFHHWGDDGWSVWSAVKKHTENND